MLWNRTKTASNPNLLYADGRVLVGVGERGNTVALDPETGEELEDLGFAKRSCSRLTGCPDAFFCRGMPEGVTRYDRATKEIVFNGAMRPSCNDGVIPANGMLYLGPWLCDCNLSLMGAMALSPAGDFSFDGEDSERLESFEPSDLARFNITPRDWPVHRANNAHNAATSARVGRELQSSWEFDPGRAITPTAPTAAGGLIFFAGDDGKVRAVRADTGEARWSFLTAGPIRVSPTLWHGRAYVGAGDGYVYCLEAATGRLLWRFRAAPVERRIMVYGRLCSNWPVNTGVIVEDGIAYVGAGLIDTDGTYVYALDAETGAVRWRNTASGHLNPEIRKGISAHGRLALAGGNLWMAGGNVVSPGLYNLGSGECVYKKTVNGPPQTNRGEDVCLLNDQFVLAGGRLMFSAFENVVDPGHFDLIRIAAPDEAAAELVAGKIAPAWDDETFVYVNGRQGRIRCCDIEEIDKYFELRTSGRGQNAQRPAARGADAKRVAPFDTINEKRWVDKTPGVLDTVSLALAPNAVVAVCQMAAAPRGSTDASNTGWAVVLLNPKTGKMLSQHPLPSRPLSGGLLVDRNGRIVVALDNGKIVCLGKPKGERRPDANQRELAMGE